MNQKEQKEYDELWKRAQEIADNPELMNKLIIKIAQKDARNNEIPTEFSGPYYKEFVKEKKRMARE